MTPSAWLHSMANLTVRANIFSTIISRRPLKILVGTIIQNCRWPCPIPQPRDAGCWCALSIKRSRNRPWCKPQCSWLRKMSSPRYTSRFAQPKKQRRVRRWASCRAAHNSFTGSITATRPLTIFWPTSAAESAKTSAKSAPKRRVLAGKSKC